MKTFVLGTVAAAYLMIGVGTNDSNRELVLAKCWKPPSTVTHTLVWPYSSFSAQLIESRCPVLGRSFNEIEAEQRRDRLLPVSNALATLMCAHASPAAQRTDLCQRWLRFGTTTTVAKD